jgi:hypothetical protein
MKTLAEQKEFALSQLAPYLKDPSTCGYNVNTGNCEYLAPNGNMCVAGKNMIEPKFGLYQSIDDLLDNNEQEDIFKPESVGILSTIQWVGMQSIHDNIAGHTDNIDRLKEKITRLNLFTYEELVERSKSLE